MMDAENKSYPIFIAGILKSNSDNNRGGNSLKTKTTLFLIFKEIIFKSTYLTSLNRA